MIKKILIGLTAFVVGTSGTLAFTDSRPGERNYDAITFVQQRHFIQGYPDDTYRGNTTVNRAELAKTVVAAYFPNEVSACTSTSFSDVGRDTWYAPYVCVAKKHGIVSGYADAMFRPSDAVNFAEVAKMVVAARGITVGTDSATWYRPSVTALADKRAIPSTILSFGKQVTRGDLAQILYRLENNIQAEESLTYDDLTRPDGDIVLKANRTSGPILIKDGSVALEDNTTVEGDIVVVRGTITSMGNTTIRGNIRIVDGALQLGANATVTGDIMVERGLAELGNSSKFQSVETLQGNIHTGANDIFHGIVQVGSKDLALTGSVLPTGDIRVEANSVFYDYLKTMNGSIIAGSSVEVAKAVVAPRGDVTLGDNAKLTTVEASGTVTIGANSVVDIVTAAKLIMGEKGKIGGLRGGAKTSNQLGQDTTVGNR